MMAQRDFRGLAIGDAVDLGADPRALFTPGVSRWYALRVAPQREDQAEAWLHLRGVYAFHPVLPRRVVRCGKVREYQRRYIPGLVFARFKGDPMVHRVLACPFITGALCRSDGVWGILDPRRLRQIHAMRRVDAEAEAAQKVRDAQKRARLMAKPGSGALFTSGVFQGWQCEVVEVLADGGAKVRMQLFGGEVLVDARVDDLVSVADPY